MSGDAGGPAPAPSFTRVAAAFLHRDLRVMRSYRFAFLTRAASMLVAIASFAMAARFIGTTTVGGRAEVASVAGGLLGFWVVGLALAQLFHTAVSAWSRRVREAQLEGTLDAVLSTAAPAASVVVASGLFDLLAGLAWFAAYLGAGSVLFGVDFSRAHTGSVVLVGLLTLGAFTGLGVLGGAFTMLLRRTDPVTALAWLGALTLGGVFYPTEVLPAWARTAAYALPIVPALEALRAALFVGAGPAALVPQLAVLAGFMGLVWPVAGLTLAFALRRAREDGSLTHY